MNSTNDENKYRKNTRTVDRANGRWRSILQQTGIPADVLDGKHHPCPVSGEGADRFRFADRAGTGSYFCDCSNGGSGGLGLIQCLHRCDYQKAYTMVDKVLPGSKEEPAKEKPNPKVRLARLARTLRNPGDDVKNYLGSRKLIVPKTLRQAKMGHTSGGVYEAMVALITGSDGSAQSYHVTYLEDGKKALVDPPRKILPPINTITGGAVRLFEVGNEMGIAEGIETAIAATMLYEVPCWAALTANGVKSFVPPDDVKQLHVFGDNDSNYTGHACTYALAERCAKKGLHVDVHIPDEADTDWNDFLLQVQSETGAASGQE